MRTTMKELIFKPMVTGIAAGIFPTLIVLYGVHQSIGEVRFREQIVHKQTEDHAALLQEKVKLIEDMVRLREHYELLVKENIRLAAREKSGKNSDA